MPKEPTGKINDIFYTLQGEGEHTGRACWFIRLQGCNLNCPWCDTPGAKKQRGRVMTLSEVLDLIPEGARRVVLTGGEPLLQYEFLDRLVLDFIDRGTAVHLETNGTLADIPLGIEWIVLSPKGKNLHPEAVAKAHELKFLVGQDNWQSIIKDTLALVPKRLKKRLTLMPLDEGPLALKRNTTMALNYALKNQQFQVRPQMHKIWSIP